MCRRRRIRKHYRSTFQTFYIKHLRGMPKDNPDGINSVRTFKIKLQVNGQRIIPKELKILVARRLQATVDARGEPAKTACELDFSTR